MNYQRIIPANLIILQYQIHTPYEKHLPLRLIRAARCSSHSGCGYYKYTENVKTYEYNAKTVDQLEDLDYDHIMVVHYADTMKQVDIVSLNATADTAVGIAKPFTGLALYYYEKVLYDNNRKTTRSLTLEHKMATRQIHLFLNDADSLPDGKIKFAMSDIQRVDVVDKAANVPLIIVGSAAGIFVGGIITLAILCNCPHVYIDNGNGPELANTLFTGAKALQLERSDYKQLPDRYEDSSSYTITLVNDLNESQYTNFLKLVVALHSPEVEVIADKTGQLHTIENPQAPTLALNNSGESILRELEVKDEFSYAFNSDSMVGLSEVYLTFPQSVSTSNGKLVLHLKNTPWSGYVYEEFNSLFGRNHSEWVELNRDKSREERELWMQEQGIQLLVDIKTDEGWKQIDRVDLVGEISYNSIIIPLDIQNNEGPLEIRLRSGFMFWELDYAAVDYSANREIKIQELAPASATGSNGVDYTVALGADDDLYMDHLVSNSATTVTFNSLPTDQILERTIILCGKGYYVSNKEYTGKTYRKELQKFREPGELSRFSRRLYTEYMTRTALN